jgi:hypothetical protein
VAAQASPTVGAGAQRQQQRQQQQQKRSSAAQQAARSRARHGSSSSSSSHSVADDWLQHPTVTFLDPSTYSTGKLPPALSSSNRWTSQGKAAQAAGAAGQAPPPPPQQQRQQQWHARQQQQPWQAAPLEADEADEAQESGSSRRWRSDRGGSDASSSFAKIEIAPGMVLDLQQVHQAGGQDRQAPAGAARRQGQQQGQQQAPRGAARRLRLRSALERRQRKRRSLRSLARTFPGSSPAGSGPDYAALRASSRDFISISMVAAAIKAPERLPHHQQLLEQVRSTLLLLAQPSTG